LQIENFAAPPFVRERTDNALPTTNLSRTDIAPPIRTSPNPENVLPKRAAARTESEDPICRAFKTEKPRIPKREAPRKDTEDPKAKNSETDARNNDPATNAPVTETTLPKRANERSDTTLPVRVKSKTDALESERMNDLNDIAEPHIARFKTDNDPPMRKEGPRMEKLEPMLIKS
jgi:hypothetical protein